MVNSYQLQIETSRFINEKVLAVGFFDVSLTVAPGGKNIAPAQKQHDDANKNSRSNTPKMIVATTNDKIYLLDWKCSPTTHNKRKVPTKILFEFNRSKAPIKNHTRKLIYHSVEIVEDENYAIIECGFFFMASITPKLVLWC